MATAELPAPEREGWQLRARAHNWIHAGAQLCARGWAKARGWRVHLALPGVAGAGLVSAGLAMRFGIWAGLICAGLFCLRADARL